MKSDIVYVERTNGSNHDGEAWIGKCFYSNSGLSIYFDGKGFKREKSHNSNYYDLDSGELYWISKVKKNGQDRHKFGKGLIYIDKSIVDEYLKIIGEENLPKSKFQIVELNNVPAKEKANEIENEIGESEFDSDLRFKNPKDLSDSELKDLIQYYEDLDMPSMYKKNRKEFIKSLNILKKEIENRFDSNLA